MAPSTMQLIVDALLVSVVGLAAWGGRQLLLRMMRGGGPRGTAGLQQIAEGMEALTATLSALSVRVAALDDQRERDLVVFAAVRVEDREVAAALRRGDLVAADTLHRADVLALSDVVGQVALLVEQVTALVAQVAGLPCQREMVCPSDLHGTSEPE